MLHAVRLVILVLDRAELDFAWPPAGSADPVQLHQLAGIDHQHPVCPFASCPLVAQNPLGLVPVEEVASGTALPTSRGIEVASVIELSEASGRVAAGLFMTEG